MKLNRYIGRWRQGLLILLLSSTLSAYALESDKEQPIGLEADSVEINDATGISIYRGNVVLTQGSIRINAESVTISQKPKQPIQVHAVGDPVRFEQRTEEKGLIRGRALEARYSADDDILHLINQAELIQGSDSFKSDRISYDRTQATVKAGASAKGNERVRVTIESNRLSGEE